MRLLIRQEEMLTGFCSCFPGQEKEHLLLTKTVYAIFSFQKKIIQNEKSDLL